MSFLFAVSTHLSKSYQYCANITDTEGILNTHPIVTILFIYFVL